MRWHDKDRRFPKSNLGLTFHQKNFTMFLFNAGAQIAIDRGDPSAAALQAHGLLYARAAAVARGAGCPQQTLQQASSWPMACAHSEARNQARLFTTHKVTPTPHLPPRPLPPLTCLACSGHI
jgi:hypothetical protein